MVKLHILLFIALSLALTLAVEYSRAGRRDAANYHALMAAKHERWMAHHSRFYKDEVEKVRHLEVFKKNAEFVRNFNKNKAKNNFSFSVRLIAFADMTVSEFHLSHTGADVASISKLTNKKLPSKYNSSGYNGGYNRDYDYKDYRDRRERNDTTENFDWRTKGIVSPVKNQGNCGSCWAFRAVATIESLIKLKTGQMSSLSEQQLVDCSYENAGCNGGISMLAFEYIIQNGGIASEDTYLYTSGGGYNNGGYNGDYNGYYSGGCNTSKAFEQAVTISGYEMVERSQEALMEAVNQQPVTTTIVVDGQDFMMYSGGVYNGGCAESTNHIITIIGYGTENGDPYWLMKNSWGTSFGEDDYMKILRNLGGSTSHCGVGSYVSYPTA